MKRFFGTAGLLTVLLLGTAYAQSMDDTLPDPYQPPIEHWGQMPEGRSWGEVAGESFDSGGNLWVVERCGANSCVGSDVGPIVALDTSSGKVLKSFGNKMFKVPHAIFVDQKDHDNVWAVDQAGQQVFKFSPDGKLLMTLGKAGQKGDGPDTFNDPTGVVIGKDGDIFVSDGHGGKNQMVARIVKFSKDGKFIKAISKKGSDLGDLDDPHSITMDTQGRLLVADRGNFRVSIFDQDGKFIDAWKQFGIPSGVFVDSKNTLYVGENFLRPEAPGFKRGVRIGNVKDGKVTAFIPFSDQVTTTKDVGPESARLDKDGNLYEVMGNVTGVEKFVPKK